MTETEALAGCRFLRSFDGLEPGPEILGAIRERRTSGVTLFRALNLGSPADIRALTAALQAARPPGDPPLAIGVDQEGGQLQAVGEGAAAWPGNLALGATRSPELARLAGRALGLEVAALGATLNFAPVCDLLQRESATHLGTRPFGDEPELVASLAAAQVEGMAESGIGTTLKHFPGSGRASADPHHGLPVLRHSGEQLRASDLAPFRAGIAAGALAVMPGHLGVPAVTGTDAEPATVSRAVLEGLLRGELGFDGLVISDAMNMGGATASHRLDDAAIAACDAGIDLLLMLHRNEVEEHVFAALVEALASGRLDRSGAEAARSRILAARRRFESIVQPPLQVVGCTEHRALAREIAEASVTLVRDHNGALPLRPGDGPVAVIVPVPADLTPAETSSYLRVGLAEALRRAGIAVDEFVMPRDPTTPEAAALTFAVERHPVRIVCTFDAVAFPGQARLLERVARLPGRCIAVALRSPYDAELVPPDVAAVCTYGIQPPQIEALADALTGGIEFRGSLPVRLSAAAATVTGDVR